MSGTQSLNGVWELRWRDGQRGQPRDHLLNRDGEVRRALPARVPGEVHLDLLNAGLIDDPAVGLHCLRARWVEEMSWLYRRSFTVAALDPDERAWLRFEQLDLAAVIFLNGVEIGRHANGFRPLRIEVTDTLRPGENELVVDVEGGLFSVSERPWQGYGNGEDGRLHKRHWLRKPQSSFSWDWSQRLINVGITGDVSLEIARRLRCERPVVVAELDRELDRGRVGVRLFVEGLDEETRPGRLLVQVGDSACRADVPVEVGPGMQCLQARVDVPNPSLWWPIGHGPQVLHDVRVRLVVEGETVMEENRRVGFRHVRIKQEPHPREGRWFVVEVNGKPIFCKGGNMVPADLLYARLDRKRYAALVDRALEANFNLLRIWGGGLYENDDFYELCDERGVMVWQEFIFACSKYPVGDAEFLADVQAEARHQVRRLAHHPSLILWCGNNELEWGNASWGFEHGVAYPDYALFHFVLPRIVKEEDGSRYYHPSSPFSPDCEHPNADHTGDQHPWSVGFENTDFRDYRAMICRFPNEGGILGPTALPTIRACLDGEERIGSFAWDVHENSIAFVHRTDRMLEQWLGLSVETMEVEEWAYYAGILQGMGLQEYIRNFRRRMFDSAAAIFWMYNDSWPMVRSWTIVDYYLRRTPSFHPVRRAFAPLTVALAVEDDEVCVYGINEGPEFEGELRYGVFALAGDYPVDQTVSVHLPANCSTKVACFPKGELTKCGEQTHGVFARLSRQGAEIARDVLVLPLYKDMLWPEARIHVEQKADKVVFSSETFAWRVCLDLDGEKALPDNFFDLLPGIPYEVDWPATLGPATVMHVGNSAF